MHNTIYLLFAMSFTLKSRVVLNSHNQEEVSNSIAPFEMYLN